MAVKVDLKGPERQVLEVLGGTWHLLADREASTEELPDPFLGPVDWVRFGSRFEELTAVFVPSMPNGNLPCQAFRSLFSGFELFRVETPEGDLLLTDDFRTAGRVNGKNPLSVTSIVDFLLFQYPAGNETFLPGVFRLGPGESLLFHPSEPGRLTCRQAEKLELPAKLPPREALKIVRETLEVEVKKALGTCRNAAVLFSGGIDSTLTRLFAGNRVITLHAEVDSTELAYEEGYADSAGRELGIPVTRLLFFEKDFLGYVEEAARELGRPFPLTNFQVVFHNRLFKLPYDLFLSGDMADRLFGHTLEPCRNGADTSFSSFVRYSPLGLLCEIFGRDLVESRVRLFDLSLKELQEPEAGEIGGDLATDLTIFFFLPYWTHYFRPLATAYGKRFVAPLSRRKVFEAALACPTEHDFGGSHPKPYLREILKALLPGYPVDARKGGSGVPRTRFCQSGPMKDFFRTHELPSGIDPRFLPFFREPKWETSGLIMQAASYRIWEETL